MISAHVCSDAIMGVYFILPATMSSIKGPAPPPSNLDGSPLRIAIVHSRWNKEVIDALVGGRRVMTASGIATRVFILCCGFIAVMFIDSCRISAANVDGGVTVLR